MKKLLIYIIFSFNIITLYGCSHYTTFKIEDVDLKMKELGAHFYSEHIDPYFDGVSPGYLYNSERNLEFKFKDDDTTFYNLKINTIGLLGGATSITLVENKRIYLFEGSESYNVLSKIIFQQGDVFGEGYYNNEIILKFLNSPKGNIIVFN